MATLGRLWAVAALTIKEAVRRKAFLALILFAVALISSMTFFSSVDAVSRLRLIEVWSHRATIFFAAIAAVFLGASSLPGDYDQKRIYVIASKPISKITWLLGKYLGLALVIAIFLGIMGAITVAYIRIVKTFAGKMMPELRARPRVWASSMGGAGGFERHPQNPDRIRASAREPGTRVCVFRSADLGGGIRLTAAAKVTSFVPGTTSAPVTVEIRGPDRPFRKTVMVSDRLDLELPSDIASSSSLLEVRVTPASGDASVELDRNVSLAGTRAAAELVEQRVEGNSDPETGETAGFAASCLSWNFDGLRAPDFPETVSARLRLAVTGIRNVYRFSGNVRIVLRSGSARHEADVFMQSNEWSAVQFPRRLLETGKPLEMYVVPGDADMVIESRKDMFVLFSSDQLFEWNYLKGLAMIYCWILIVLTVSYSASVFLSSPVSMLLGILVLLVGALHEFVGEGVRDIDISLAKADAEHAHGGKAKTPEDLPPWVLRWSSELSKKVLYVFPSSSNFDFSFYLLNDLAISPSDLKKSALQMLFRVAAVLLLGILVMIFKDFG